ncbi:MAG: D-aminoacyl-tRNA deacylase [Gemmatimonadales bacterium]
MRVVLQRVKNASVTVDDRVVGRIGHGFLVLAGFAGTDDSSTVEWMAEKIAGLRLFGDGEGKMNLSLGDVAGEILVVSQFTLYGDTRRGRRPSFVQAAPPAKAESLYDELVAALERRNLTVETGVFGAMMDVALVNDGPVTLILER